MYTINREKFSHAQWDLLGAIITAQSETKDSFPTSVSFRRGWLRETEWYKRDIWEKAQEILRFNEWNLADLQSADITSRIIRCMDIPMESGRKQNLLDWRDIDTLKSRLISEQDIASQVLYMIFRGENEEAAFNNAVDLWGERYPFISFLFFLKDKSRFLPVRPNKMKEHFEILGIKTDCLNRCTWENYAEYLCIINDVKKIIVNEIDNTAELIDAHSFVWSMWVLNEHQPDAVTSQFEEIDKEVTQSELTGDTRKAIVDARINQSIFRERLLQRYSTCCLCGVQTSTFLKASHIKPWCSSTATEKIDVDNGFLLCPDHDCLFDKGYISFSDDGNIIISEQLSQTDQVFMNVHREMQISLTEGNKRYLDYHRRKILII